MKLLSTTYFDVTPMVRPLAGAGIEIGNGRSNYNSRRVRPLAGAGIEIQKAAEMDRLGMVRPLAGAGIEMRSPVLGGYGYIGSPPRGGGN